jgi:hypothetical protein
VQVAEHDLANPDPRPDADPKTIKVLQLRRFINQRNAMPTQDTFVRAFIFAVPTALLAALGAAFGAYWQQTYAVQLEKERTLLKIRMDAYTDFFKGQVARNRNDEATYETLVQNARFPIAVYSSKPAVEALANYFEYSGMSDCKGTKEKWQLDIKIYQQMRRELYEQDYPSMYQRAWSSLFGESDSQQVDDDTMTKVIYVCRLPR